MTIDPELYDKFRHERNAYMSRSQELEKAILNAYSSLFPTYAFVSCEAALNVMVMEFERLRQDTKRHQVLDGCGLI